MQATESEKPVCSRTSCYGSEATGNMSEMCLQKVTEIRAFLANVPSSLHMILLARSKENGNRIKLIYY